MREHETLVQWYKCRTPIFGDRADVVDRLAQADREYAEMEQAQRELLKGMAALDADRDKLRDERERLLRLLANTEKKLTATAAAKDALAARCDQRQEYIDQITADKEALRQEHYALAARCDKKTEEIAELQRECGVLRDANAELHLRIAAKTVEQDNAVPSRPEPTRLEIAAQIASGLCAGRYPDTSGALRDVPMFAWTLAGELLAKAGVEAAPSGAKVRAVAKWWCETHHEFHERDVEIEGCLPNAAVRRDAVAASPPTALLVALRRIADDPRSHDEPGTENGRYPAWEYGEWARAALAEYEKTNAEAHGRAVARTVQPLVGSLDSGKETK